MLDLEKIIIFKTPFWKNISVLIQGWIKRDMMAGVVQEYTSSRGRVYSKTYAKYKKNYMNRLTTRTYKKGTKHIPAGTTTRAGTKLQAYSGVSIRSNSSTPNMLLTGQTIDGLEYKSSTATSLTMSYKDKDKEKIENNELLGRSITTLNNKNQDFVVNQLEDELSKNITDWERDKIILSIGK